MHVRGCLLFAWVLLAGSAHAADAPAVVVGSKRFTESYILGEIVAQTARRARAGRAPPGPGQHRGRARGAEGRRDRRLSRVHRHHRRRDPQERQAHRPGGDAARTRADGPRRRGAAGLPEHLCAGDDGRAGHATPRQDHQRPRAPARSRGGGVARVPRPRRRLAGPGGQVRTAAEAHRHRPRHLVRGAGLGPHRGDRHLFHRRQDRRAQARRARRRPAVLPALRRGAAVPARSAEEGAGGLGRDPETRRPHRCRAHDRDERRCRVAQPRIRRHRARLRAALGGRRRRHRAWRLVAAPGRRRPRPPDARTPDAGRGVGAGCGVDRRAARHRGGGLAARRAAGDGAWWACCRRCRRSRCSRC